DWMKNVELSEIDLRWGLVEVAFSKDDNYLVTLNQGTLTVWNNWDGGPEVKPTEVKSMPAHAIALNRDGNLLAVIIAKDISDNVAQLWAAWDTGTPLEVSRVISESPVRAIALSPDGTHLAVACG